MKLSPELKKLLHDVNISEGDCQQKLTERGMHVMHTYIKLIHLRLKDNMPDQQCVDQVQNSRICELMSVLDTQGQGIPEKKKSVKLDQ